MHRWRRGKINMVDLILATFAAYLILILIATYYVAHWQQDTDAEEYQTEFYVGGRDLGVVITMILVAAAAISPGTFIGSPGFTWEYGPAFTLAILAQGPLTLYLLGIYGKKMAIVSRRINADSLLDLYKARYEAYMPLIVLLGFIVIIFTEAYLAAEFAGGARAIAAITGLSYEVGVLIFGGIIVIYTTLGGLRGTGIVGIIGGLAMTFGTLALLVASITSVDKIFLSLASINPELLVPPGHGISWYRYVAIWVTFSFGYLGIAHSIQGNLGVNSTTTIKRSAGFGVIIVSFWTYIVIIIAGSAGKVINTTGIVPDQNIPLFTLSTLPDIPAGIVLAGVVGAAQTTIGAMAILISSAVVVNIYQEYINENPPADRQRLISTIVTAIVGIVGLLLGLTEPPLLEIIVVFAFGGLATGLAPPLLLGFFWPQTNKYGAFVGSLIGVASYLILKQWAPGPIGQTPIIVTLIIAFVFTIAVSYFTEPPSSESLRIYFGRYEKSEHSSIESNEKDEL
jgi:sodium/pantothenate symporter